MSNQIVFHHREFEYEVREKLGKPEGPITVQDVSGITELDCSNFTFDDDDIDALKQFAHLESLDIVIGNIDLSFLSAFRDLKTLYLDCWNSENELDFSVFSELHKLEELFVSGGIISSIKYFNLDTLIGLKKLKKLWLHEFGTVDLAFLAQMPWIEHFFCGYANHVSNIDCIGNLKNLKSLDLTDVEMDNLDFLNSLPKDLELVLCGDVVHADVDMEKLNRFSEVDVAEMTINGQYIP